ncbi:MAG TPA: hypothetical protein VGL09_18110 [Methylomirabilota bacterium]|jgi:hypothetical protein
MNSTSAVMFTTLAVVAAGLLVVAPAAADGGAKVAVKVATPPPPTVVVGPVPPTMAVTPTVMSVPGSSVMYVPNASFNLFVYSGRYYSLHNGTWFYAPTYKGPWMVVGGDRVPQPVLAVPVTYYKVPPGRAKKDAGPAAAHGKGPKK